MQISYPASYSTEISPVTKLSQTPLTIESIELYFTDHSIFGSMVLRLGLRSSVPRNCLRQIAIHKVGFFRVGLHSDSLTVLIQWYYVAGGWTTTRCVSHSSSHHDTSALETLGF